jgi:hypothetical protein
LVLLGCFLEHASPTKKLQQSVAELNKSARWGQIGAAARMVEPTYRDKFIETHAHWGKSVQIADSELLQLEVAPGGENAIAMIAYSWYAKDVMTLHGSVVQQRWVLDSDYAALLSETVIEGDPRLLHPAPPAPMRDALGTSGGELSMSGLSGDP